jgi:hypothetical protein
MCQRYISLAVIALLLLGGSIAHAQCGCSSPPVYTSVAPSYSSNYAPVVTNYTPVSYASYYAPPAAYAPAPYVTYYAPPVAYAPTPYVSYYAPAAPYVAYAPVVAPYRAYYGVPGWSIYGTPRVYVPGEPVRNTVKAVLP